MTMAWPSGMRLACHQSCYPKFCTVESHDMTNKTFALICLVAVEGRPPAALQSQRVRELGVI